MKRTRTLMMLSMTLLMGSVCGQVPGVAAEIMVESELSENAELMTNRRVDQLRQRSEAKSLHVRFSRVANLVGLSSSLLSDDMDDHFMLPHRSARNGVDEHQRF